MPLKIINNLCVLALLVAAQATAPLPDTIMAMVKSFVWRRARAMELGLEKHEELYNQYVTSGSPLQGEVDGFPGFFATEMYISEADRQADEQKNDFYELDNDFYDPEEGQLVNLALWYPGNPATGVAYARECYEYVIVSGCPDDDINGLYLRPCITSVHAVGISNLDYVKHTASDGRPSRPWDSETPRIGYRWHSNPDHPMDLGWAIRKANHGEIIYSTGERLAPNVPRTLRPQMIYYCPPTAQWMKHNSRQPSTLGIECYYPAAVQRSFEAQESRMDELRQTHQ